MKFLHLSDLHIGKRVNEFSMIEDQEYILQQILNIVDQQTPDAVLICGDVYDKSVPPAEAVTLFDDFLVQLTQREKQVFIISGNHDSAERIAFGGRIMHASGVHVSPLYGKDILPVTLTDEYGMVQVYLLPFVKPVHVRACYPNEEIASYTDALRVAVQKLQIDYSKRNILLAHQFIAGSERSESEEISVGGLDNVSPTVFDGIDYVALGHLHKAQSIMRETIRYSGTPLKYSVAEHGHEKSITMVECREKGNVGIHIIPLIAKRDIVAIKGSYAQLTAKSYYENLNTEDYYHITLTDEQDIVEAMGKLRVIYKNIMKLEYDNRRTRNGAVITGANPASMKSPFELVAEFYQLQNNQPMTAEQMQLITAQIEQIWEDEECDQ